MSTTPSRFRRVLVTGAVVTGTAIGAVGIAAAATGSTTTTTPASSSTTAPAGAPPGSKGSGAPPAGAPDPATVTHGPNETLLTGTELEQATAAATAAVPGATVVRAETDSSGTSPYEVHMKKSDGTFVTVELDSSFHAVATVSGFGTPPPGARPGPGGTAPAQSSTA